MCVFFFLRHNGISYLIDYSKSANITFLGSGKPERSCDFHNFNIRSTVMSWNQTKSLWGLPAIALLLSRSVVSDSATPWAAARQPSLFFLLPGACSNSCPWSQWCHPTTSSSAAPFSSCLDLCQHQGLFQRVSALHQVAKVLKLQHQTIQRIFRVNFL